MAETERKAKLFMEALAVLLSAAVSIALVSGAAHYIKHATANGSLSRNFWIGLRTGTTMSSDAAWEAAHKAAAPWLTACAYTGYAASAAMIALAVYAATEEISVIGALMISAVGFAGVTIMTAIAAVIAHRGAKDALRG
ncbi:SdpI family protein [Streptomonospora algeriensis]|uniref:SdpI family protein n=1 Tax=Streptomonospora algeriensis TaxID=995084 RepID=A0ABW3BDB6_9ACTN